jgi:hypothetical protein
MLLRRTFRSVCHDTCSVNREVRRAPTARRARHRVKKTIRPVLC